ncbi:FKBP-type peptidyl-prolyl cis-trans isomerase [Pedobacter sp. MW01-1-1]|uniref:FKBP-type peptidyl-prolyl cis-trans isomerase n=1 Tax=Pedobacter sp. MW01-1-1 TaxID=3383027 RepID=UPI003FEF7907
MNKFIKPGLIALFAAVIFSACKKEYQSIESLDDENIQKYIKANNLTMTKAPNGSYYQVVTEGTGEVFKNTDSVLYTYEQKSITDGTVYVSPNLNGNSAGYYGYFSELFSGTWGVAMDGHRAGTKVRILIPSHLAYGKNGNSTIGVPSNAIIDNYITTSVYNKQALLDNQRIQNYLTTNKITAQVDPSGINYVVGTLGTGGTFNPETATLVVKYTGRLLDGTVFDSSTDGTFSTKVAEATSIIQGWKIMIPKFPVGTKFRMFIPSALAYGGLGSGAIPPNAVLDFDIEIVSATD